MNICFISFRLSVKRFDTTGDWTNDISHIPYVYMHFTSSVDKTQTAETIIKIPYNENRKKQLKQAYEQTSEHHILKSMLHYGLLAFQMFKGIY